MVPVVPRTILHVDMDAFFASVEIRDNPSLRGKPVLVGYEGKRGVVAAASYEARKFGCHSAQPMALALRKCPQAVVVHPDHARYVAVSREVFAIFGDFTPLVEGLSIDEAFLDVGGTERLFGPPRTVAEAIRKRVRDELRLTCSVGIAANKFVAKVASERNKPDGLTEVPPGTEREFLAPLPVRALWGVGPKTAEALARFGVTTIGDIARLDVSTMVRTLGDHGAHLHRLSHGLDAREVDPEYERKQVSHENTFHDDLTTRAQIEDWLLEQATRVADRLVEQGVKGRKLTIKLREAAFITWTRQCTIDPPTDSAARMFELARTLLDKFDLEGKRFRLTGLAIGELVGRAPEQLEMALGDDHEAERVREDKQDAVQDVMSEVRRKFGGKALFPGGVGSR
jgi:DNA polymerase-4